MTLLDWIVLIGTITFIVAYGTWRSRGVRDAETYFRDQTLRWPTIGLSIMATQASAITFLSTPGQGYDDGLRFVQFYFGLPLAMIVISAVFVPIYYRLNVFTAYEYLEQRFDVRVRYFGALLFLVQRGLAAGVTIYAPSIVLSSMFGWPLQATNVGMGVVVILYTVLGGTQAVSQTQKQQMIVMMGGTVLALGLIVGSLPPEVSLGNAVKLAGALDRMNAVSFDLDFENRYNFWSGLTGGFFLALAYFGTDQSQVQRYLSGKSLAESRLGLLFNGMFKVPMQFLILFSGVMVFVFYLFTQPPLFFNTPVLEGVAAGPHAGELRALDAEHRRLFERQRTAAFEYVRALEAGSGEDAAKSALREAAARNEEVRKEAKRLIARALPSAEQKDMDYVFLGFVTRYVPSGLVGLLIAVILCAAMSSIASELTALGSTTTLDLYQRMRGRAASEKGALRLSKIFTAVWGLLAMAFAAFAALLDNLIQAVNILGSLFYGTMLGIFLVGFFVKRVSATPVLIAALAAEALVLGLFFASDIGFLWYNVIGSACVVLLSLALEPVLGRRVRGGDGSRA